MENGFFKIQRRFFSHWLWEEDRAFSRAEAWLDMLQMAAFKETKRLVNGKMISIPIGGIAASERFLGTRWKWSRSKVRAFLSCLVSDQMLDQQKDHGETVLILCNYKRYALSLDNEKTTKEPEKDHRGTTEEPNKKKDKKDKKENDSCPQADEKALLLEIWNLAPSKSRTRSSKKKVFDAWKRIPKQSRPTPLDLITAIKAWAACEDWTKDGGQYAPGLHLWIKDQKWEDLPEGPTTSTPKPAADTGPEGWQDAFHQLHPNWITPVTWYLVDNDIREEIQNHLNTKQP